MARGDFVLFEEFTKNLGDAGHNLSSDTLKLGIVTNIVTPTADLATPTWADFSANDVAATGGYTANGETLTNVVYTEAAGVGTLDADNVSLAQNALGFTDGAWGILYNATSASTAAIGYVDLGGPVSEQDGPVAVNWNASGILRISIS